MVHVLGVHLGEKRNPGFGSWHAVKIFLGCLSSPPSYSHGSHAPLPPCPSAHPCALSCWSWSLSAPWVGHDKALTNKIFTFLADYSAGLAP